MGKLSHRQRRRLYRKMCHAATRGFRLHRAQLAMGLSLDAAEPTYAAACEAYELALTLLS